MRTCTAAFFSGRGYYSTIGQSLPGTGLCADVVSVLPIVRELHLRANMGFAPCGVLQHIIGKDWVPVSQIAKDSGYKPQFVGAILEEAAQNGWVELDLTSVPRCRSVNYRIPARECIAAFIGDCSLAKKLDSLAGYRGVFNQVYFVFDVPIDDETTDAIASNGYGILRFYEKYGSFLEHIPAGTEETEDIKKLSVIAENVLFENIWLRKDELI